jgi:NAD(P)-dependent dehydrogenase (short-subunit alcohol dehydrogenase family)
LHLAGQANGWRVFAGVRKPEDAPEHAGITPVIIDVTQPASITTAAQQVQHALGPGVRLDALINNAGKCTLAPMEFMPIEVFEDQLQVRRLKIARW